MLFRTWTTSRYHFEMLNRAHNQSKGQTQQPLGRGSTCVDLCAWHIHGFLRVEEGGVRTPPRRAGW